MATDKTVRLPLGHVEKTLKFLGLRYAEKELPNETGIQLRLAEDDYDTVVVTAYKTGSVQVQPQNTPEAAFVRTTLRLRSLKLRRKGVIS
jgi:hypothetical protein